LATLPFVGYAIFRYQYLSEQGDGERPEELLLNDTGILTSSILWGVVALTILLITR